MITDPVAAALAALDRMATLFAVADGEHSHADLLHILTGVRHEHQTAVEALKSFGGDILAPRAGSARSGDPGTSHAAARAIATRSGSQRHTILRLLAGALDGMTDPEMQHVLMMVESSQRTRRHELCKAGYVRMVTVPLTNDGPERVPLTRARSTTGQQCLVWEITPKGRVALAKLNSGQMVLDLGVYEIGGTELGNLLVGTASG